MPKQTPIEDLTILVQRSVVITQDRKDAVIAALPTMSPPQIKKLKKILQKGTGAITKLANDTIAMAIGQGDGKVLKTLDTFFTKAGKKLRKVNESADKSQEKDQLEHIFDDV